MKYFVVLLVFFFTQNMVAQKDANASYRKRVLETTEVDFLASYYVQNGDNASVTGGIGNEFLTDAASSIIISIPLNADDVLTLDSGISAYTSASSSNGNPFDKEGSGSSSDQTSGSPWVASSGASKSDVWGTVSADYSHSSEDRNFIWNANVSYAMEYDYTSLGFGGGVLKQFNNKNTSLGLGTKIYLDHWSPIYPIELKSFKQRNRGLQEGFYNGDPVLDQNGEASADWRPLGGDFDIIHDTSRNTYSASFSFSQILNQNAQVSLFIDVVSQKGWLANPLQRVYFGDIPNYYLGNKNNIDSYTSSQNKDVFQLADDIERLPKSRLKTPLGMRFNYYLSEVFVLRTYYRYYFDDWGLNSHTASIEVPVKVSEKFTLYPSYRFYTQTAANYFAPYEGHLSSQDFYTSDYDLSAFYSNQFGFGVSYVDIFVKPKVWRFGLKSVDLKYYRYDRNSTFESNLVNIAFKFVMD